MTPVPTDSVGSPFAPKNLWQSWFLPLEVLILLRIGGPFIPIPNGLVAGIIALIFAFGYVGAVVAFVLAVVRYELSIKNLLIGLALCGALWAIFVVALPSNAPSGHFLTTAQIVLSVCIRSLQDFALMGAATFGGCLIARFIRYPNLIGPIGVIVALIDIWGVLFGGIVSQLITNKATASASQIFLAQGPHLGRVRESHPELSISLPVIGAGDFLFIALFLAALLNLRMNWRASAVSIWVASSLAMLLIIQPFLPIPVLPGLLFIGLGAIAPNLKYFSFTRDEKFALLWAGGFVLILTGALYFGVKHALPS